MSDQLLFSTPQACALADVTFRQIDYWVRTSRLSPHQPAKGSGSQRRYTQRDTELAWVLSQCSASPHPLPRLDVLNDMPELHGWLVVHPHGAAHVAADDELLWELAVWPNARVVNLSQCPVASRIAAQQAVTA